MLTHKADRHSQQTLDAVCTKLSAAKESLAFSFLVKGKEGYALHKCKIAQPRWDMESSLWNKATASFPLNIAVQMTENERCTLHQQHDTYIPAWKFASRCPTHEG
jgi:hypothetical protein